MHEFHIHVDATSVPAELEQELMSDLALSRRDFAEAPTEEKTYTPDLHYTTKPKSARDFRLQFPEILRRVRQHPGFVGYIEGEFIPDVYEVAPRTFDPTVDVPFRLNLGALSPGRFRESEVHVTMSYEKSDPRLRGRLVEMGLFPAFYPKPWGLAQIFTMQGTRAQVSELVKPLLAFLSRAGGSVTCRVKEERIAKWWMSSNDLPLPPVIAAVDWGQHRGFVKTSCPSFTSPLSDFLATTPNQI